MSVTARFAIVLLAASQNIWYNRNVEPEQFPGFNETDIATNAMRSFRIINFCRVTSPLFKLSYILLETRTRICI